MFGTALLTVLGIATNAITAVTHEELIIHIVAKNDWR